MEVSIADVAVPNHETLSANQVLSELYYLVEELRTKTDVELYRLNMKSSYNSYQPVTRSGHGDTFSELPYCMNLALILTNNTVIEEAIHRFEKSHELISNGFII